MTHVLIAVDDNEKRAVAQVESILGLTPDVRATVLHVFTENPEGASVQHVGSVRRAKNLLEDAGVDVSLAEDSGDPSKAILRRARDSDVDLISVSGRKRSPAGKALIGSVSQSVLLGADCPVLFTAQAE